MIPEQEAIQLDVY